MFSLFAFLLLGPQQPLPITPPRAQDPAGIPARLWWGDFDGDSLPDLLAAGSEGRAQLLRNQGEGVFADVTTGSGLAGLQAPALASWIDLDGDARLDLVAVAGGALPRLFRNLGQGVFEEVPGPVEEPSPAVRALAWVDFDGDALPDLQLATDRGDRLYRNLGEGRFEPAALPETAAVWLATATPTGAAADQQVDRPSIAPDGAGPKATAGTIVLPDVVVLGEPGGERDSSPSPVAASPTLAPALAPASAPGGFDPRQQFCPPSVQDSVTSSCVSISSVPMFGTLYPLGPEFNIDAVGQVGIGTTLGPLDLARVTIDTGSFPTGLEARGNQTGVLGLSQTESGVGVRGENSTGVLGTGVHGLSQTVSGVGVRGEGSTGVSGIGENIGVRGWSDGIGVLGYGRFGQQPVGVWGDAEQGFGVLGYTSATTESAPGLPYAGVFGENPHGKIGAGVFGLNGASSGPLHGVLGVTESPDGAGVKGENTSSGAGVRGLGRNGVEGTGSSAGVFGESEDGTGVWGNSGSYIGVVGQGEYMGVQGFTSDGFGVYGATSAPTETSDGLPYAGVLGANGPTGVGAGVFGFNHAVSGPLHGVLGVTKTSGGAGVMGENTSSGAGVRGSGEPGVLGESTTYGVEGTGNLAGVFGESDLGDGVFGVSGQTSGTGFSSGIKGRSFSPNGNGVFGWNTDGGVGVLGDGETAMVGDGVTTGLYGTASDPAGVGVWGDGDAGVIGDGQSLGVLGTLAGASGVGVGGASSGASAAVAGHANGVPGFVTYITNSGVSGVNDSTIGAGVVGANLSTDGVGVAGRAGTDAGAGVAGSRTASFLIYVDDSGVSGVNDSDAGYGVAGLNSATTGNAVGVFGLTSSPDGIGVLGQASSTAAVGVLGVNTGGVGALGVLAQGDLGATGTKSFIQPHPRDASKEIRFVCLEGNESGTYFRGSAELASGVARIGVPEEFRLVTEPEGLTVQVTPRGPGSLWVERAGLEEIVVRGSRDVEFDYFVNGVRRGFGGFEPVRANVTYVPETLGVPYGAQYPEGLRAILVENGILNADHTPSAATAARLGWKLRAQDEDGARLRSTQDQPQVVQASEVLSRRETLRAIADQPRDPGPERPALDPAQRPQPISPAALDQLFERLEERRPDLPARDSAPRPRPIDPASLELLRTQLEKSRSELFDGLPSREHGEHPAPARATEPAGSVRPPARPGGSR